MRLMKGILLLALPALTLVGCFHDDDDDDPIPDSNITTTVSYQVEVTNLTSGQPLSPIAIMIHSDEFQAFRIGEAASTGVEQMAEGGDNSMMLSEADASAMVYSTDSGDGPLGPGASATFDITADLPNDVSANVSVLSMLVNTNDAIAGVNAGDISELSAGTSITLYGTSYDAGTEANTETADSIPGPAGAGGMQEGFNSARDDVADQVTMHGGVVTNDDGLATSALTQMHRWDNPTMKVVLTRMQ